MSHDLFHHGDTGIATDRTRPIVRAGDCILHKPSGEKWLVAAVSPRGDEIVCCGWPESIAPMTDCQRLRACSDHEHMEMLRQVADHSRSDLRASWARQNLETSCRSGCEKKS